MDDREAVKAAILNMPNDNLLIELPTGHGKDIKKFAVLTEKSLELSGSKIGESCDANPEVT